jgi:hypothetical protein
LFFLYFVYKFCFLGEVTNTLASHEELAGGMSIGWVGLELTPHSLVVGATPRPTAPGLEHGQGMCLRFLTCTCVLTLYFFGFSGL